MKGFQQGGKGMYIREYNSSAGRIHTDQPGFVIHILYEWLVIFISYFYLSEHAFLFFVKKSSFPGVFIHTHNPVFLLIIHIFFKYRPMAAVP